MPLQSKTITIRDDTFEVRELTVEDALPMMRAMSDDNVEGQFQLMGKSVYSNGQPLGDDARKLGVYTYQRLIPVVMEVNGLDADEDEEGEEGNA